MIDPYQILGISPDQADDSQIRQAYLEQVKRYPPEQAPERFKQIRNAYEQIKDERSRLAYQLFQQPGPTFEQWLDDAMAGTAPAELSDHGLRDILSCAIDDDLYRNHDHA